MRPTRAGRGDRKAWDSGRTDRGHRDLNSGRPATRRELTTQPGNATSTMPVPLELAFGVLLVSSVDLDDTGPILEAGHS